MTLGQRLKRLRKSKKWTLVEAAEKLQLKSHSTYSNWEYDRTEPDLDTLSKLADLYEVPVNYLMFGEVKEPSQKILGREIKTLRNLAGMTLKEVSEKSGINIHALSNLENGINDTSNFEEFADLVSKVVETMGAYYNTSTHDIEFRSFDNEHNTWVKESPVEAISQIIKQKYNKNEIINSNILKAPILGYIAAGQPILAEEHIEEWTEIPNMWNLKDGEVFLLKVKGDSMIGSRIYDGDKVVVKMQPDVENGEIAVVNVNGDDATLKRVKKTETGQVILYPDNPKYDPIFITSENARIIGKVIQVMFEPSKNF